MFVFLVTLFLVTGLAQTLLAAVLAKSLAAHGARRQTGGAILVAAGGALA